MRIEPQREESGKFAQAKTQLASETPELKETIELIAPQPAGSAEHDPSSGRTTKSQKPVDKFIGTTIGDRFEILASIGTGSTTAVYKAQDKQKKTTVAVKVLRGEFADNEYTVLRFQQECRTLKLLAHHNIVAYCDQGTTDDDRPYLVMEYLSGSSLKQLIETSAGVPPHRAVKIFVQACAALAAAHEKGVIHRDLKPANIMVLVDSDGNDIVKVLDFGVSKLLVQGETFQTRTQTGEMLGTLLYMSPEQCLDQDLDGRSDLYSLGCVMFETLTGTPPISARTAFETMNKHLTQVPEKLEEVRPDLVWPAELETIIQKCLAKAPADRPASAVALQKLLLHFQTKGGDVIPNRFYTPPASIKPPRPVNAPLIDSDVPEKPALTVLLAPILIVSVCLITLAALVVAGLGHFEIALIMAPALMTPIALLVLKDLSRQSH